MSSNNIYYIGTSVSPSIFQNSTTGPISIQYNNAVALEVSDCVKSYKPISIPATTSQAVPRAATGFVNLYFNSDTRGLTISDPNDISEPVNSATGPTGPQGIQGPIGPDGSVVTYQAFSTLTAQTTSSSYVDLPGMSVTVNNSGTAKYYVCFTGDCYTSSFGANGKYIINVNGSDITHTERSFSLSITYIYSGMTQCLVDNVPNGAVVKVRYKMESFSSTSTFLYRNLYVMQV